MDDLLSQEAAVAVTQAKPLRLCIECGRTDDHPRHATNGRSGAHIDCHALAGCESCGRNLAIVGTVATPDGVKGADLAALLVAHRAELKAAAAAEQEG